ncbi:MAG TPA: hypothetical protein VGA13_07385 [Acidimicrobiales bacterium]
MTDRSAPPGSPVAFAAVARAVADGARRLGLRAPGFRSPPRLAGADRTIRRGRVGDPALISVRVHGRPLAAVIADVIEGVVVANDLDHREALAVRSSLWAAVHHHLEGDHLAA